MPPMANHSRALACFIIASTLLLTACSQQPHDQAEDPSGTIAEKTSGESVAVEVNSPAPAFAAKVMGGGELRLSEYVGKVVLLEFWSVFCKSCLEEMPSVKELHKRYRDQGFEVISVNTDAFSDARVLKVLEKAGMVFDYPVVRDLRKEVSAAYNVQLLPVTVVIDRSGWIRLYQEGYRPGEEKVFEEVLKKYLSREAKEDVTLAPRGGVTAFAPAGSRMGESPIKLEKPLKRKTLGGGEQIIGGSRPVALFFWSLYCQPCREELPQIEKISNAYTPLGVDIVAVSVDSDKLNERIRKYLAPYPGLACVKDGEKSDGETLSAIFNVAATPTVLFLNSKGEEVHASRGQTNPQELEKKIRELLKDRKSN